MPINPQEKKKKVATFIEDKDVALFAESMETNEILREIASKEEPKRPDVQKVELEGAEKVIIKGEQGEKGDTGETGDKGEKGDSIKGDKGDFVKGDKGDKGDVGDSGKDGESVKGEDGKDGKDGSPDTAGQVKNKLMEEGITIDDVLDLREELTNMRKEASAKASGGVRRVFQPYLDRFTDETDGATKIFFLSREPLRTNTIKVWGTDFPIILDPTVDFTVEGKTLTLTDAVPAPSSGATLIVEYYA